MAATVLSVFAFGTVAGATKASAAPLPVLALTCSGDVFALVGQPVTLAPVAVVGKVTDAVRSAPGLGAAPAASVSWTFGLLAPFRIGEVPNGTGRITGSAIADRVVEQAMRIAPLTSADAPARDAVAAKLRETLTPACGINAKALNPKGGETSPPPTQQPPPAGGPSPAPPPGGTGPGHTSPNTGQPGGTGAVPNAPAGDRAAPRDYGSTPYVVPGQFAPAPEMRYGGVPGTSLELTTPVGAPPRAEEIRTAGDAEALPRSSGRPGVELPMLLAVLALSGVTAALVRTWVLRRG